MLTLGVVSGLQRPEPRPGVHLDSGVTLVATTAPFMKVRLTLNPSPKPEP